MKNGKKKLSPEQTRKFEFLSKIAKDKGLEVKIEGQILRWTKAGSDEIITESPLSFLDY